MKRLVIKYYIEGKGNFGWTEMLFEYPDAIEIDEEEFRELLSKEVQRYIIACLPITKENYDA